MRYEADVVPRAQAIRDARLAVRAMLAEFGLAERRANAVLDVAHELLLNAQQHGSAPIRLAVEVSDTGVLVQVHDGSPEPARTLPYRPGISDHGLGLRLVRQLAVDWGQDIDATGKTVWARIV